MLSYVVIYFLMVTQVVLVPVLFSSLILRKVYFSRSSSRGGFRFVFFRWDSPDALSGCLWLKSELCLW